MRPVKTHSKNCAEYRHEATAVKWYARAADAGEPDAPEAIGGLFLHRGIAESETVVSVRRESSQPKCLLSLRNDVC